MRSRSDSEPTRIPTTASGTAEGGDVGAILHAGEIYVRGGGVCGITCGAHRGSECRDVQNPASIRDEPAVMQGRSRVEDECARRLRVLDPAEPPPRVAALRMLAAGQPDRPGWAV